MDFIVKSCIFCASLCTLVASIQISPINRMAVRLKNLRCEHINPKIYNGTVNCSIKPTRNGTGITNVRYTYRKPCSDLWVYGKLFYKFPTGTKFQPWPIEFDENVCERVHSIEKLGGFSYYFAKSVLNFAPGLIHACPYIGEEGLKDANVENIFDNAFPQIIPKGVYKLLLRFHLANNDTFLNVWFTAQIDAQDPMKALMPMGK